MFYLNRGRKRRPKKSRLARTYVNGIDVSSFQGQIDWSKVAASGVQFAYIKATEGVTIVDQFFAANRKDAVAAGIICGAYHLFRPLDTAQAQVDAFVAAIGKIEPGELPPVLDVEVPEDWKNIPVATRIKLVSDWLIAAQAKLGVPPIVYVNISDAAGLLNHDPAFARNGLWVAFPTTASQPVVPAPWTDWTFWQHAVGTVSGVPVPCDQDRFQGSLSDLLKLVR
jgi:lysozyme